MTKEDHGKPDLCGKCHDGTKAFSQSAEADCGKCHKKAVEEPKKEEPKKEEPKEEPKKEAAPAAGEEKK